MDLTDSFTKGANKYITGNESKKNAKSLKCYETTHYLQGYIIRKLNADGQRTNILGITD